MSNGAYAASREQGAGTPIRKKKRPADSPDFLAGPATGNASVNQPVRPTRLPVQLAPEDRLAATGETTVGWLTRRYGLVLDSGWDPQQVPLTVIHDLATSGVDDGQLRRVLNVTAPLQERLTSRLLGPGVQGQAGVGVEAAGPASGASPLPRPQVITDAVEPTQAGLGISPGDVWNAAGVVAGGAGHIANMPLKWAVGKIPGSFRQEIKTDFEAGGETLSWPVEHLIGRPLNIAAQYAAPVTDTLNQVGLFVGEGDNPLERLQGTRFTNPRKRAARLAPPSWDTAWRRAQESKLGGGLASLSGIRPEDPEYEKAVRTTDLFGSFALDPLLLAGNASQGIKAARSLAVTGDTAKALEGASTTEKITRRLIADGGDLPRSRVATATYQLFAKTPEKLVETGKAKAAIDDLAAATSPTYIADRYRLPAELAETLAKESNPERVKDWVVAGLNGVLPTFEAHEIGARIAANTERYESLKADVLAGKIPEETVKARMDGLALDTLQLQRQSEQGYRIGHYIRNVPTDTLGGWVRQVVKRGMERPGKTFTVGEADPAALAAVEGKIGTLRQRLADDVPGAIDEPAGMAGDDLRRYRENNLTRTLNEQAVRQDQNLGTVTLPANQVRAAAHPVFQALNWAYGKSPNLRGLFEMLPTQGSSISVMDKTAGRVHLERIGQLLRVPRAELDRHLDQYINATGPQEVSAVYRDLMRAGQRVNPEIQEELLRLHQQSTDSLYHVAAGPSKQELHSAKKMWKGQVVEFGQPQLSSELLTHLPTPDVRGIRDAVSLSGRGRRLLANARAIPEPVEESLLNAAARFGISPKYLTNVFNPLDMAARGAGTAVSKTWAGSARVLTTFTRAVWKPAVLLRFGFTGRQLGEEHVAMAAAGLPGIMHPVQFLRSVRGTGEFARFAEVPEEVLMNYARSELGKAPTGKYIRVGDKAYTPSWRGELKQLQASDEVRELLHQVKLKGDGPESVDTALTWLNNHPHGRAVWAQHEAKEVDVYHYSRKGLDAAAPTPEEIGDIQRQWIEGIQQRIQDKTAGNQHLLKLVRDGELRLSVDEYAKLKFGGHLPDGVQDALDELNTYSQGQIGPAFPPHSIRQEASERLGAEVHLNPEGKPVVKVSLDDEQSVIPFLDSLPNELKPAHVKGTTYQTVGGANHGFINAAFHFIAGMPLNKASRMPAYREFASGEFNRLVAAGWSETKATELASEYAVQQMKHLMFDLGEKSLFNEQMAVLSPFMNAWQQAGRRYFLDIPGRQGFGIGQAALARKGQLLLETAKQAGWVRENERGETVTHIPGLDRVLEATTGIPFKTDVPLSRFTMLGQVTPGLGPVPMYALTNLPGVREWWGRDDFVGTGLDILQPFGPESSMGPAWLNRVYMGAFKTAPFWELNGHSAQYQKYLYDGSVVDAMRLLDAKEGKANKGVTRLQRIGAMPESREKTAEFDKFLREAKGLASEVYIARGVSGAVLPAQSTLYWPNQQEADKFNLKLNEAGGDSGARRKLMEEFLTEYPHLSSFLVGKSRATPFGEGIKETPAGSKFDVQQYWAEVRKGARERLTPEEWGKYGGGAVSYNFIQHQYHERVNAAGTTAKERLENWALVKEANRQRANDIATLERTNPEWKAQHDIQIASAKDKAGKPTAVWQEELAQDLYHVQAQVELKLSEIDPDGELDLSEFKNIRAKLMDKIAANPWATSQPGVDGEVARYWRDVAEPYYQQLDKLYDEAKALPKGERAPLYEKIREFQNNYHPARGMPSPEEVAFKGLPRTSKTPGEPSQADRVAKWSTNPPGWLTNFQRQQLGLPVGEEVSGFWSTVNKGEQIVRELIAENNWAPASREARNVRENFDKWKLNQAKTAGLTSELEREEMPPFERVWSSNQLTGPEWQPVRGLVTGARQALAAYGQDGRPAGIDSQVGTLVMDFFATQMQRYLQADPSLLKAMGRWGKIMSPDDPLVGTDLYRRWFFGAFR